MFCHNIVFKFCKSVFPYKEDYSYCEMFSGKGTLQTLAKSSLRNKPPPMCVCSFMEDYPILCNATVD